MNSLFGLPYAYPVSIGFNCHVKVLIERLGELDRTGYPRLPFDWIGTPMYSVCELLEKDFEDFTNPSSFHVRRRNQFSETEFLTNELYDFCFVHDYKNVKSISEAEYKKVEEDYKRRIQRWKDEVMESGRHIVFFRLEQLDAARIFPETKREGTEKVYLERFCKWMLSKGVKFHVIWFSQTQKERLYDKEHHIIILPFRTANIQATIGADPLQAVLANSLPFVKECLRKISL